MNIKTKILQSMIILIGMIITIDMDAKKFYIDAGLIYNFNETSFLGVGMQTHHHIGLSSNQSFSGAGLGFSCRLGFRLNERFFLIFNFQAGNEEEGEYILDFIETPYESPFVSYREKFSIVYGGLGLIYYLTPQFQIGATVGRADLIRNIEFSMTYFDIYQPYQLLGEHVTSGIGLDISFAYDLTLNNFGILIGVRNFYATDSRMINSITPFKSNSIGLFTKIRR